MNRAVDELLEKLGAASETETVRYQPRMRTIEGPRGDEFKVPVISVEEALRPPPSQIEVPDEPGPAAEQVVKAAGRRSGKSAATEAAVKKAQAADEEVAHVNADTPSPKKLKRDEVDTRFKKGGKK